VFCFVLCVWCLVFCVSSIGLLLPNSPSPSPMTMFIWGAGTKFVYTVFGIFWATKQVKILICFSRTKQVKF
jgi:hypothetical protein